MESKIKRQDRAINSCQVTTRKKNKTVAKSLTILRLHRAVCVGGAGGSGGRGLEKE